MHAKLCGTAGGEPDAQEQGDHEDVTTKEDARPDGLVSAYWETIGERTAHSLVHMCALVLLLSHVDSLQTVSQSCCILTLVSNQQS